jgi:hypothetical protein
VSRAIDRLSIVYNARGGIVGELAYAIGRRRGTVHCALCEVTHGRVREKPAWRAFRSGLAVPVDAYHLNDRPAGLSRLAGGIAPVVAAHIGAEVRVLLGPDELEAIGGAVDSFSTALERRRAELGLEWASSPSANDDAVLDDG